MVLSDFDRSLLAQCLEGSAQAWDGFVDRYLGLVCHVVRHTAHSRSLRLTEQDQEDLVASVFLAIVDDDFALLRKFRGESSLATYLTVVARRVVVRELLKRRKTAGLDEVLVEQAEDSAAGAEQRLLERDEVERLLGELSDREAEIVRLYHLEGKSYQEISAAVGIPENSVGPTLSRAREKLRRAEAG